MRVIICCFLVVMLDGFDTAAMDLSPLIFALTGNSPQAISPPFWRGSARINRRRTALWPVVDRFGRKRVIELCVFLFGALSSPRLSHRICKRWSSCAFSPAGSGRRDAEHHHHDLGVSACRRRGALVTLMFCGFTLGSALAGLSVRSWCR